MKKLFKKPHLSRKTKDSGPNKHAIMIFIIFSLIVASGLVGVSLFLYNTSGAAQLDLSRPGYTSVRSKASSTEANTQTFSSDGKINKSIIEKFKKLFSKQANEAKSTNAFSGDPLNPSALGLETTNSN